MSYSNNNPKQQSNDAILRWLPAFVLAGGIIASAAVMDWRVDNQAEDIEDVKTDVRRNEDNIESIQKLLIQRQGETQLQVQRIENVQRAQGEDITEILKLLKEGR